MKYQTDNQNLKIWKLIWKYLGKGNTNVPGFDVPPVEDLLWGQTVSGKLYSSRTIIFIISKLNLKPTCWNKVELKL